MIEEIIEPREEPREDDAVRMEAFVLELITAAIDDDAETIVASADEVAITKVKSCLTKSPRTADPQLICAGNVPCVELEYE